MKFELAQVHWKATPAAASPEFHVVEGARAFTGGPGPSSRTPSAGGPPGRLSSEAGPSKAQPPAKAGPAEPAFPPPPPATAPDPSVQPKPPAEPKPPHAATAEVTALIKLTP